MLLKRKRNGDILKIVNKNCNKIQISKNMIAKILLPGNIMSREQIECYTKLLSDKF